MRRSSRHHSGRREIRTRTPSKGAVLKSITLARSHLANEVKRAKRTADPESRARVTAAREQLIAAKLEAHIAAVVAGACELSPEVRSRLATLLRGVS